VKTVRKAVRHLRPGDLVYEGFDRGPVRIVRAAPASKSPTGEWVVTYLLPRKRRPKMKACGPDELLAVRVRRDRRPFPRGSVLECLATGNRAQLRDTKPSPSGERNYRMVHPGLPPSRAPIAESEVVAMLASGRYRLVQP
jgi:hypothetical protein